jgi:phospholipase C
MSKACAIEHVVLVLFENRSFDHLLGWLSHPRHDGNTAVEGLTGDVDLNTDELLCEDYRNPACFNIFRPYFVDKDEQLACDLPHGRDEVARQMAHSPVTGAYSMRGFAASFFHEHPEQAGPNVTKADCMRMLGPNAIPVTSFLARNFTVCDHWFSPIPTDTHPNRMMSLSGYTEIDGTSSLEPDQDLVIDWADRNGIGWRVYSEGFSYLMCLRDRATGAMRGMSVLAQRATNGNCRSFASFAHDLQYDDDFPSLSLIEPGYSDDPFEMEPSDNHPPLQVGPGEAFLLKIYSAFFQTRLARQRLDKTLLLVYYDEHGGFFDHVPPLTVLTPSGRLGSNTNWPSFSTTGPRVPAIVVSPLADAGVFKQNLDHTSVLRFLAERFTPGKPFNDEVAKRHAPRIGGLVSLGNVITRSSPRPVPDPPAVGMLPTLSRPNGLPVTTPQQQAFAQAHHDLDQTQLAKVHPESFFARPAPTRRDLDAAADDPTRPEATVSG